MVREAEQPLPPGKQGTGLTPGGVLGLPVPGTPHPMGTALVTLGGCCIKRDFAEFSAVLLGLRSPGQGFLGLSPAAGAQAEPGCGAASLRSN